MKTTLDYNFTICKVLQLKKKKQIKLYDASKSKQNIKTYLLKFLKWRIMEYC